MTIKKFISKENFPREYSSWQTMKNRCSNHNDPKYKNHGGKGITVCDKWIQSFMWFFIEMGDRPENKTLDRIDNSLGYYRDNCKWSTMKEQNNNKDNNVILTYNGESLTVSQWAEKLNISKYRIYWRIGHNWSVDRILAA